MNPREKTSEENEKKEAYISNVILKGERNKELLFETGEKVFLEIEVTGNVNCKNLSVTVLMKNDDNYHVFDTSTQRLDNTTFSLKPGERKKVMFEMILHLVPGTYHLGAHIYRYDIQKMYDMRLPVATIQVRSEKDVQGVVNLYPKAFIE
jgi:hypothetical protein